MKEFRFFVILVSLLLIIDAIAARQRKICIAAAAGRVLVLRSTIKKIIEILVVLLVIQTVAPLFIPPGLSLDICIGKDGNLEIALAPCPPALAAPLQESKANIINQQNKCEDFRVGCIESADCDLSAVTISPSRARLLAYKAELADVLPTPIVHPPAFVSYSSDHPSSHLALLQTVTLLI